MAPGRGCHDVSDRDTRRGKIGESRGRAARPAPMCAARQKLEAIALLGGRQWADGASIGVLVIKERHSGCDGGAGRSWPKAERARDVDLTTGNETRRQAPWHEICKLSKATKAQVFPVSTLDSPAILTAPGARCQGLAGFGAVETEATAGIHSLHSFRASCTSFGLGNGGRALVHGTAEISQKRDCPAARRLETAMDDPPR